MFSILNITLLKSRWVHRLSLIVFGGLYPLGFSPVDIWPLTLISIALLVNELIVQAEINEQISKPTQKTLGFFSIVFYWSLGAFGLGVSWVYVSIHEFGHVPLIGAVAISFLLVLTLSLIKAFGGYLIGKIVARLGTKLLLFILPFIWVVFEFIQTFIFSGFPWLFAGYSQIDGPMWKLSTWLGVYGVSWFLVIITTGLVFILRGWFVRKKKADNQSNSLIQMPSLILILFILVSVPTLAHLVENEKLESSKKSIKVALVQPNIPQEQKWDRRYFSKIIDILYEQSENHWNSDLLVWPEGAIPAYQHQVVDILSDLNQKATESQTDLLLGLPVYFREKKISYSALVSLGNSPQSYHKQVLVPFGEYVPLGKYLRGVIEFLNLPMSSFSPATAEQAVMDFKDYQVIPAICYEITYPDIVYQLATNADEFSGKPKLLVTVSNDAWFGDSLGPYQHMQMARMRALELGIPLVRSTNDGITGVVDAKGNVIQKINRYQQKTLQYEVSLDGYKTPYRSFGLNGIYLVLLLNGLFLAFYFFINEINRKNSFRFFD